jgi:rhodanese-related sulfurtransferase
MRLVRHPIAVLALVLATVATSAGHAAERLNSEILSALARQIARGEDHVTADQLAKWLVENRRDFALIDIRSAEDFAAGHIKGATNVALLQLLRNDSIAKLPAKKRIVLYANDTRRAAQTAAVLRLAGIDAFSLLGGYVFWVDHALNPKAELADADTPDLARRQSMARALKECPRLPEATIFPPGAVPAAMSVAPPPTPAVPGAAPKSDVPLVIGNPCGG